MLVPIKCWVYQQQCTCRGRPVYPSYADVSFWHTSCKYQEVHLYLVLKSLCLLELPMAQDTHRDPNFLGSPWYHSKEPLSGNTKAYPVQCPDDMTLMTQECSVCPKKLSRCPEKLWMPHAWKHSRSGWMGPKET